MTISRLLLPWIVFSRLIKWFDEERKKFKIAGNPGNKTKIQYKFRTVVSEISFFVDNPVFEKFEKSLLVANMDTGEYLIRYISTVSWHLHQPYFKSDIFLQFPGIYTNHTLIRYISTVSWHLHQTYFNQIYFYSFLASTPTIL